MRLIPAASEMTGAEKLALGYTSCRDHALQVRAAYCRRDRMAKQKLRWADQAQKEVPTATDIPDLLSAPHPTVGVAVWVPTPEECHWDTLSLPLIEQEDL
jgi:hypothetical protein